VSGDQPRRLAPAPTVEQPLTVSPRDIDDEKKYLERAEFCWKKAQSADDSQGPKWAAESAKYERLARAVRDKINEIESDAKRMAFMAQMKGKR
jgi:hypothetical protein